MKADVLMSCILMLTLRCQDSKLGYTSENHLTLEFSKAEKQINRPMKPTNPINFIPGITIKPSNLLLDWLNKNRQTTSGRRKRFRLPVVVRFKDSYRLAIGDAFVGKSDTDIDKDTIFLSLDDSAMGISLLDRLRNICPKSSNSCNVWLEGYWGSLLELDVPDFSLGRSTKWPFTVLKLHEVVQAPSQVEEIKVFIESPSP